MVTLAEAHDVVIVRPWYAPPPRKVAIHRYLDSSFVDLFHADITRAPELNPTLFAWEAEDRLADGSGLKLRRPLHRTFHMVAWEACCDIPNARRLPAIDPGKIASAGFVIRSGDSLAPQGFQLSAGAPVGWADVEPGVDPEPARQVKALGLVPRGATTSPGYTGEEVFPLHPMLVQSRGGPRTILSGFLPISGQNYVPAGGSRMDPNTAPEELPWPFGLAGRSKYPRPIYTFDQQINRGQIESRLAAVLRVLLGRYQLSDALTDARAWSDQLNQALIQILDKIQFYLDPKPMPALSGQALRDWAAANPSGATLGSVLRDGPTAASLLAALMQAAPTDDVALPKDAPVRTDGRNLLITQNVAGALRAALRARQIIAFTASSSLMPVAKLVSGPPARYFVVPFVRTVRPDGCERIFWGDPSENFAVAAFFDPEASRPALIEMPDLSDAMKGAAQGASFDMPPKLADLANSLTSSSAVQSLIGGAKPSGPDVRFICSFSLPVITICAMLLLSIVIHLLNLALQWIAWVKICLPFPSKSK